jgi:hypothetical protein
MKHFLLKLWTIVFLSLFAGAAIFVLFVMVPAWKYMDPEEVMNWFKNLGSTIGLVMMPMEIIPLILSGVLFMKLRRENSRASHMWMWVNCLNVAVLISFFVYFLPVNMQFINGTMAAQAIPAELDTWKMVHALRTIAIVLSVIIAIRAFRRQTHPESSTARD